MNLIPKTRAYKQHTTYQTALSSACRNCRYMRRPSLAYPRAKDTVTGRMLPSGRKKAPDQATFGGEEGEEAEGESFHTSAAEIMES